MTTSRITRSRYRTIEVRLWDDERFMSLSRCPANPQFLWVYLLSSPQSSAFPGLYRFTISDAGSRLGWGKARLSRALNEILAAGMARFDKDAGVIFLPNAIRCNPPQSPNAVIAWGRAWSEIPSCSLKTAARDALYAFLVSHRSQCGEAFMYAFHEAFGKPSPYQEKDQDQEQEKKNQTPQPPASAGGDFSLRSFSGGDRAAPAAAPAPPAEAKMDRAELIRRTRAMLAAGGKLFGSPGPAADAADPEDAA